MGLTLTVYSWAEPWLPRHSGRDAVSLCTSMVMSVGIHGRGLEGRCIHTDTPLYLTPPREDTFTRTMYTPHLPDKEAICVV